MIAVPNLRKSSERSSASSTSPSMSIPGGFGTPAANDADKTTTIPPLLGFMRLGVKRARIKEKLEPSTLRIVSWAKPATAH